MKVFEWYGCCKTMMKPCDLCLFINHDYKSWSFSVRVIKHSFTEASLIKPNIIKDTTFDLCYRLVSSEFQSNLVKSQHDMNKLKQTTYNV